MAAPLSPVIESWLIAHNASAFLVVRDGFTVGPYGKLSALASRAATTVRPA